MGDDVVMVKSVAVAVASENARPAALQTSDLPAAQISCGSCGDIFRVGESHSCLNYKPNPGMANLRGGLGTRAEVQQELDGIAASVRAFYAKPPDEVMRECSAYTARLTELCVLLARFEGTDRQYHRLRTQQVERWLAELDRQYKAASRQIEVQRQDLAMIGGQA